ncbi:hypothetical protein N9949_03295 [Akkermansiaceae bacterium]|nr:hypothetical protein [Akkermansiaceae bacterium]MDB4323672.1 hypothetical protein [Akkermansiaceae bacterium]
MASRSSARKRGPKNPVIIALKAYFLSLGSVVAIGGVAYLLDFNDPTFWKVLGPVGLITPFVLAREAWKTAEADLENFTKKSRKTRTPVVLPEIDLDKVGGIPGSARVPIEGGSMRISMASEIDLTPSSRKLDQTLILGEILNKVMEMEDGPGKDEFLLVLNKHLDEPVKLEH